VELYIYSVYMPSWRGHRKFYVSTFNNTTHVTLEVFEAVNINAVVFWDVTPCRWQPPVEQYCLTLPKATILLKTNNIFIHVTAAQDGSGNQRYRRTENSK
jgi:hypothetical protein